jgi:predicted nuclease of predicted toxin-antitoxin system
MTIWVDAHLSPAIATWIASTFGVEAIALRDLGLRDAEDPEIFEEAKVQEAIVMTKDSDFVDMVERLGSPPQIIWLTCGNTSNAKLREILSKTLPRALELLDAGETLVEISGDQQANNSGAADWPKPLE